MPIFSTGRPKAETITGMQVDTVSNGLAVTVPCKNQAPNLITLSFIVAGLNNKCLDISDFRLKSVESVAKHLFLIYNFHTDKAS